MLFKTMRFCMLWIFLAFAIPAQARNPVCLSMFSTPDPITVSADLLHASQDGVGHEYARIKTLKDAGIDSKKSLNDLSKHELKELYKSLIKETNEIPAVIAPNGKIFIIDGHHDFFILSQIQKKLIDLEINIVPLRDFSKSEMTMAEFKELAKNENWFYGSIEKIVDHPKQVRDLPDNVERSQMGLAFLYLTETFQIPMKGKHFRPFIQFKVIDALKAQGIFQFHGTDAQTIALLAETMMKNKPTRDFLISELKASAPDSLKDFLKNGL